jgi:hypothetical protein
MSAEAQYLAAALAVSAVITSAHDAVASARNLLEHEIAVSERMQAEKWLRKLLATMPREDFDAYLRRCA